MSVISGSEGVSGATRGDDDEGGTDAKQCSQRDLAALHGVLGVLVSRVVPSCAEKRRQRQPARKEQGATNW